MIDNQMLIFQISTAKDLAAFVCGNIETGKQTIIILHLKTDCLSMTPDTEFQQIKRILYDPCLISVLVIDCEFSMNLYEKMYVFDLCLLSEEAALRYDPEHRNGLRFLHLLFAPHSSLGRKARIMNYEELINHGFANAFLRKESFYEDLEAYMLSVTMERTKEQLYGIKSCINTYKESGLLGETLTTDPEACYFCQLALIKTEENKKR